MDHFLGDHAQNRKKSIFVVLSNEIGMERSIWISKEKEKLYEGKNVEEGDGVHFSQKGAVSPLPSGLFREEHPS
jgi:hypothetical protein